MPSSQDQGFFAEQNDFSLIVARTAGKGRAVVIEELREAPLVEKTAIEEALLAVFPAGAGAITAAAIRPAEQLHLASADEGKRLAAPAAVQKFVRESAAFAALQPGFFAIASAREGAGAPWLLTATAAADHQKSLDALGELQLKPERTAAASLHAATALTAALKARGSDASVLCVDLGALTSHALVVTRRGIESAGSAAVSLDSIAEAVQAELGLKFKGSAAKLFFNELYDFSETGPKIAARLAPAIKASIASLAGSPTEFYCSGLPGKQQWLAMQLAAELGLVSYTPDVKAWASGNGISFGNPALESALSPAWLGFLHFVYVQSGGTPGTVWSGDWISTEAVLAAPPPPVVITPPPVPAPAAKPAPVTPAPAAPRPATVVTPPPPKPTPLPVTKPAPAPLPVVKPAPSAATYPPKPTPAPAPAKPVTPPPAAKPAPAPAPKTPPAPAKAPAPVTAASAKPAKKGGAGMLIGVVAAVIVLGAGAFFYMQSQKKAEEERIAKVAEQAAADKRVKEEAEKARLIAEQKARDEAEARKKYEAEIAARLAAADAARVQAENEARAQAAARIANARGSVVITTEPAGASVTLAGFPARTSPATYSDIKIGKYPVTISLPQHDEVKIEVEVKENATTELPVVRLTSTAGTLEIASEPAGATYEVRPANQIVVAPETRLTGQTPAVLPNLPAGEYTVTLTREGWAPHTQNVTIGRNATANVAWTFPNGMVKISSDPAGATVMRNGKSIGVTPLTLSDQQPGDVRYELTLAGYEPSTLSGRVESGKALNLTAPLLSVERLARLDELDKKPEVITSVQPDLPVNMVIPPTGARVEIEVTVTRTGVTKDVRVLKATNTELGNLFAAALAKWKWKPGQIGGKAVNVRVQVPFTIAAP